MAVVAGRLAAALPAGESVLLDTSVLIAYLRGDERASAVATFLIDGWVRAGRNEAFISTISVMEVLVGPMKSRVDETVYVDFLQRFPHLTCVPLGFESAYFAAQVRAKYGHKPPDALIIGTAMSVRAAKIVTNDASWKGKSEIPIVTLAEF